MTTTLPKGLAMVDAATGGRVSRIVQRGLDEGRGLRRIAADLHDEGVPASFETVRRFVKASGLTPSSPEPETAA